MDLMLFAFIWQMNRVSQGDLIDVCDYYEIWGNLSETSPFDSDPGYTIHLADEALAYTEIVLSYTFPSHQVMFAQFVSSSTNSNVIAHLGDDYCLDKFCLVCHNDARISPCIQLGIVFFIYNAFALFIHLLWYFKGDQMVS